MKLAFLIMRNNYFRLLGSIIDEALRQGWQVECWHNYNQSRSGGKAYLFPAIEAAPEFMFGKPAFKSFHNIGELKSWVNHLSVDAVVSLDSPAEVFGEPLSGESPLWISIQHLNDFFNANGLGYISSTDLWCMYSEWWYSSAITYFNEKLSGYTPQQINATIARKAKIVGVPEFDKLKPLDAAEVRQRWGIPHDRPVVALLPYPAKSSPTSFWSTNIYMQPSRLKQLYRIVRHRRFKYFNHVLHGWNDFAVVAAVKKFCKRNGAYLLVKSRLKDPIPPHTQAVADRYLYDEKDYPATILEVMSIASLCINFYSYAVTEASFFNVPNLCISVSMEEWRGTGRDDEPSEKIFFNNTDKSIFRFPGVSTIMSIPEVIEMLPRKSLSDFKVDSHERKAYVEKFLGYDDGQSSKRVLDEIQALVAKRKSQT